MMLRLNLIASDLSIETIQAVKSDESRAKRCKKISEWIEIFKGFTERQGEKCCNVEADLKLEKTKTEQHYLTGAKYKGQCDAFGINGKGTYTFPDGVTYDGEFKDGMFHGKGRMKFTCGTVLRGPWSQGLVIEPSVILEGELHHDDDRCYCAMPDRRFCIERKCLIQPAGKSYLTNKQPTRVIPDGLYDAGDGWFDPVSKDVLKYNNLASVIRAPGPKEQKWILKHCRKAPDCVVGPAKKLYEQFAELKTNLYEESPEYGVTGLMDYDPELEDRLVASKKLLEKRILPKTLPTQGRRFTIRDFQNQQSRILS